MTDAFSEFGPCSATSSTFDVRAKSSPSGSSVHEMRRGRSPARSAIAAPEVEPQLVVVASLQDGDVMLVGDVDETVGFIDPS